MTDFVKPGEIRVKNMGVMRGLMEKRFHPTLIEIETYIAETYGNVITESYRDPRHPGDVHATDPVRALDLRSWCYADPAMAKKIEKDINARWVYDPERPRYRVARIHRTDGGGWHFHIQVHDNTRRRL